jgi:hypothetical protein
MVSQTRFPKISQQLQDGALSYAGHTADSPDAVTFDQGRYHSRSLIPAQLVHAILPSSDDSIMHDRSSIVKNKEPRKYLLDDNELGVYNLPLEPYPWRQNMTLCIAAVTGWEYKATDATIVVAADWRVETGIASAKVHQQKLTWICAGGWVVLMAAEDIARASELTSVCDEHLSGKKPARAPSALDAIKEAVAIQKRKLIEEYIQTTFGITYDSFLLNAKKQFTDQTRRETEVYIRDKIKLQCSLLLCTFLGNMPIIFEISGDGIVRRQNHFGTIGSGSYIAHAALYQREHTSTISLAQGAYHVHEAMKLGSIAPGVGETFAMAILKKHGANKEIKMERISDTGTDYLDLQYEQFGLKPCTLSNLPDGCWESF